MICSGYLLFIKIKIIGARIFTVIFYFKKLLDIILFQLLIIKEFHLIKLLQKQI